MMLNNQKQPDYIKLPGFSFVIVENKLYPINSHFQQASNKKIIIESSINNDVRENGNKYLLNINKDSYIKYLKLKFIYEPILIDICNIGYTKDDKEINLRIINTSYCRGTTRTYQHTGKEYKFIIPVQGSVILLTDCYFMHRQIPYGKIEENNLIVTYQIPDVEADNIDVQKEFNKNLETIMQVINKINTTINQFNQDVIQVIEQCFDEKVKHLNALEAIGKTITYPLIKNNATPETFPIPEVKRNPQIHKPEPIKEKVEPEPELEIKEYDHILKVCSDMAQVMERSPHIFEKINEEDLRIHFLIQLNGWYEGQATGETFNLGGKTDVLIRSDGQNVFIAECKYWHGKKLYQDTIDQLLGYVTFRDTKTAILIFNRNKDFSNVLKEIQDATREHPNFVSELKDYVPPIKDSSFSYKFKNKNDENKQFYLTVMAFDVPRG